jgi:hypothetical protein
MFAQKQKSVAGLFDRLAKPERTSRDHKDQRLIAGGTWRAPHAADAPEDLNTNDDSDFVGDDTWFE